MSNLEKYDAAFRESFACDESFDVIGLRYNSIEEWDSIGHMNLIGILEEEFDIAMDMDDIIEFESYKKGIELLSKYGVVI